MSNEQSIKEAEELFEQKEFKKEAAVLQAAYAATPGDVEISWRVSRNYFSLFDASSNKDEKKDLITKGLDVITKALEANPDHWAPHKWYAVCVIFQCCGKL
jgi:hypothetical protein